MAPPTFKKLANNCDKLFKGFDGHTEIKAASSLNAAFPKQGGVNLEAVAAFDKKGKDSMSFEYNTKISPAVEVTGTWETTRAINQSADVSLEHKLSYSSKDCCNGWSADLTHQFGEKNVNVEADLTSDKLNATVELPFPAKGITASVAYDTGVAGLLVGAKVSSKDFSSFAPEVGASYALSKNASLVGNFDVNKGARSVKLFYKADKSLAFGLKANLSGGFGNVVGASAAFDYKMGKDNLKVQADLLKKSANFAYKLGGKYTFTAAAASLSDPTNLVCGLQVDFS
jgi:hypothetical protein